MKHWICLSISLVALTGCIGPEGLPDDVVEEILDTLAPGGPGNAVVAPQTLGETFVAPDGFPQAGAALPELGGALQIRIISRSPIEAEVIVRFRVADVEVRHTRLRVAPFDTTRAVGPDVATHAEVSGTYANGDPLPPLVLVLDKDFTEGDSAEYVIPDPTRYTLTISVLPEDAGTVLREPDAASYAPNTSVRLSAAPADGYAFDRWEGDLAGAANPAVVEMDGDRAVTAVFVPVEQPCTKYELVATVVGAGGGLVPASGSYCEGTVVTLTAQANLGMQVAAWTGTDDDSLTTLTNTVTMSANRIVTVEFRPLVPDYALAASVVGGHGTIEPTGGTYPLGTVVTLTATPDAGYGVKAWTGTDDDSSTATTNRVTMNTSRVVTVTFEPITPPVDSPRFYVDAAAPAGGDGATWLTAFRDLQDGLAAAREAVAGAGSAEIWVAEGVYTPDRGTGDRSMSFVLSNGVALYGGFVSGTRRSAQAAAASALTVLSGDLNGDDDGFANTADNSYHVVTGSGTDGTALLSGFTISGGNATDAPGSLIDTRGGGMWNVAGNPVVMDCVFEYNQAAGGAGMFNKQGQPVVTGCTFRYNRANLGGGMLNNAAQPMVYSCTFIDNQAVADATQSGAGGAMYNWDGSTPVLNQCTFRLNSADFGGAVYADTGTPTIAECEFSYNDAGNGGAILTQGAVSVLTTCTFTANTAGYGAGVMFVGGTATLADCVFDSNAADEGDGYGQGGGILLSDADATVAACTFHGNTAGAEGGGLYADAISNGELALSQCTFEMNRSRFGGGGFVQGYPAKVVECLFRGNAADVRGGGLCGVRVALDAYACEFERNTAQYGAGLNVYTGETASGNSSLTAERCRFAGNRASVDGGGAWTRDAQSSFTNSLFVGNQADRIGGGVFGYWGAVTSVVNCTFSGNGSKDTSFGGMSVWTSDNGGFTTVANSIFWGNSTIASQIAGPTTVSYSGVQGGFGGTGNSDADPRFLRSPAPGLDGIWGSTDDDYGDLRLSAGSPCIDSGDGSVVPSMSSSDLEGEPRFTDDPCAFDTGVSVAAGAVDRGAYEYAGTASCEIRNLQAMPAAGAVNLTWDGFPGVRSYRVYVDAGSGYDAGRDTDNPGVFRVSGLTNGVRYRFKVSARDGMGVESAGLQQYATPFGGENGLAAIYSTDGSFTVVEGPIFHGYWSECTATGNNYYQGACTPPGESPVNWAWGSGFSVTWAGYLYAPVGGDYRFASRYWVDGYVFIEVNGVVVADLDTTGAGYSKTVPLEEGSWVPVRMEFIPNGGSNNMHLGWVPPGAAWEAVPPEYLCTSVEL